MIEENEVFRIFGGEITPAELEQWLDQFAETEIALVEPIIRHFRFYSSKKLFALARTLHQQVLAVVPQYSSKRVWFVPFGYVAKSGSAVAYFYRRQNDLPQGSFISLHDLNEGMLAEVAAVVLLDDFIGSGEDALALWQKRLRSLSDSSPHTQFIFACVVGYESGIARIESSTRMHVAIGERISDTERPFTANSSIYSTIEDREKARELFIRYGSIAHPKEPLGFAETQSLVGFFFSTPNNTLPVFWARENGWKPLLPHGESLRDPSLLLGPPAGVPRETLQRNPRQAIAELDQIERLDIPPDTAIRVLQEFQRTSALLPLATIIKELGLSNSTVEHLVHLIRHLKDATHEQKPVASALLVIPPASEEVWRARVFAEILGHLSNEQVVEAAALLVDGYNGAIVFGHEGDPVGAVLFESTQIGDPFLPARYWPAALASQEARGLLLLFSGRGRVQVFFRGQRVLSHRAATWHVHSLGFDRAIADLAGRSGSTPDVTTAVLKTAFLISDVGDGALFVIGDQDEVLKLATTDSSMPAKWHPMRVQDTDPRIIAALARQDGATVVGFDGTVLRGGVFLHPPPDAAAEKLTGKGSRHDAAAKITAVTKAVTIAVSVDGQISAFSAGKLVFKVMG